MEDKIYVGVDIGTDSVGYAVTNQDYKLRKFHGEPMWGVTLFEKANLRADRRSFRTARRRLDRRQQRVELVQELFAHEINALDSDFYERIKKSGLCRDEAESPFSIFNDANYTDKDYHKQYPTIHHLLTELMYSDEPHDVRLVYLACAWLVAHRGHFLSEVSVENISELTDFSIVYNNFKSFFCDNCYITPWNDSDETAISEVLKKKIPLSAKYSELSMTLFNAKKAPKTPFEDFPFNCEVILKALCGSKVNLKDLFFKEEYSEVKSFSLGEEDENLAEIFTAVDDDEAELLAKMKSIYDWSLLVDALQGKSSISEAKVEAYNKHKSDLEQLKRFVRKYTPQRYNEVFNENRKDNYKAYINKAVVSKKASNVSEEFLSYIKKLFGTIKPDENDKQEYDEIKQRIELGDFLPKQRVSDNRVIPYQLYWYELKTILEKAEQYLPFLKNADETGMTVTEKLLSVFSFRIPYFVGPLNERSNHAWIKRKAGKIYPWNFDEMVDLDASEQAFINRMTGKCTYLPEADVIPKESLLYSRFCVLNEINNITIENVPISVELKQEIFNELFCKYRKVSMKKLNSFLKSRNYLSDGQRLDGIDNEIKSNLRSYHDFKRLLENEILSENDVEKIISQLTYSEDKLRIEKWLRRNYSSLEENDIKYISRLNYKDFGRLSAEFLNGLEGANKETGEVSTIINALWNTNNNLMKLLSDRFTFIDEIEKARSEYYAEHSQTLNEQLDDMYISNAVKRPIIRTLEIIREVEKACGKAPDKIFVEMPRGAGQEQKNKRTVTRKQQILNLYQKCAKEDVKPLIKELEDMGDNANNKLQSKHLFLYFLQLGRCMYSGEPIDISLIGSEAYNIDHIYPRSITAEDSKDVNTVLVKSTINGEKSDVFPIPAEIRNKMRPFWEKLKKNGLLSDEKFKRLTRSTPFSDDERFGFINSQLTETSQSAKAVTELLKERYPNTEIVYVKARLAAIFRQKFELLKSRTFNDLHHAKDAYLNIVAGNIYSERFKKRWFNIKEKYNAEPEKIFENDLARGNDVVWNKNEMLPYVKKVIAKNNAHMTRYAFCRHGGLFDQQPISAKEGLIPRKDNLPTEKYGGYNKPTISFFLLVKYRIGKKMEVMLMPVELIYAAKAMADYKSAEEYAKDKIGRITGKKIDEVSFPLGLRKIKINTMLSLDGFRVCITGASNGGSKFVAMPYMPFAAPHGFELYIKRLERFCEKNKENPEYVYIKERDEVSEEENIKLYDLYIDKLENSIYKKRPNRPTDVLKNGRDKFISLDIKTQSAALLNIHQVFGRTAGGIDFTAIGGVPKGASSCPSTSLSNLKKNYSDIRIIDSSASGLWEKVSENLLDLL